MLRKIFALCLIALAGYVHAGVIVDLHGIRTYDGTYDVETTNNTSASLLSSQPWFGDPFLAGEFAFLVQDGLGFPNSPLGPLFAADLFSGFAFLDQPIFPRGPRGFVVSYSIPGGESPFDPFFTYAIASKVTTSVPEPATVSLFAAGLLGLGLLRRRRPTA
jgi:hypothetical protein